MMPTRGVLSQWLRIQPTASAICCARCNIVSPSGAVGSWLVASIGRRAGMVGRRIRGLRSLAFEDRCGRTGADARSTQCDDPLRVGKRPNAARRLNAHAFIRMGTHQDKIVLGGPYRRDRTMGAGPIAESGR